MRGRKGVFPMQMPRELTKQSDLPDCDVSIEGMDDLEFEANGELQTAVNDDYIKLPHMIGRFE